MDYSTLIDNIVHIVFAIGMAVTMCLFLRILRELLEIRTDMLRAVGRLERLASGSVAQTSTETEASGDTSRDPS